MNESQEEVEECTFGHELDGIRRLEAEGQDFGRMGGQQDGAGKDEVEDEAGLVELEDEAGVVERHDSGRRNRLEDESRMGE